MGVASLVLGVLAIVLAFFPVGPVQLVAVVIGVVSLILGIVGRKNAQAQSLPTGVATAGIVVGIIGFILAAALFATCTACRYYFANKITQELKSDRFQNELQRAIEDQASTEHVSDGRPSFDLDVVDDAARPPKSD